jgi:hypothetical protein
MKKKIVLKCKELKEEGIPLATLEKLERKKTYQIKHKKEDRGKKKRT